MREPVRRRRVISATVALFLVSACVLIPLGVLIARSLSAPDGPAEAWQILGDRALVGEPLTFAATQALLSMLIGAAAGLPASFLLSQRGVPLQRLLSLLLLVPVGMPPVVTALGVREVVGDEVTASAAIVIAHSLFAAGVMVWLVTPAWTVVDRRSTEAARVLGASRWLAFWTLSWPQLRRQLRAALAVAFLGGFTALATVQILGGSAEQTFESVIATASLDRSVTRAELAALALAQLGVAAAVTVAGHATWRWPVARPLRRMRRAHVSMRLGALLYLVPLASVGLIPLGAVIRAALLNDGAVDADAFSRLLQSSVGGQSAREAIVWTLVYGLGSGTIATLLAWGVAAVPARWRRPSLVLLLAPFVMTPVVLALTLREGVQQIWPDLDRAVALVFLAHTLLAFPIAWRVTQYPATQSRRRLREAAQLLGDRPRIAMARWGDRRVVPALTAATCFAYALSAAEVGAAWLLAPDHAIPIGVALLESTAGSTSPGRPIFALATILGLSAVLAFLFAERFRRIAARAEVR